MWIQQCNESKASVLLLAKKIPKLKGAKYKIFSLCNKDSFSSPDTSSSSAVASLRCIGFDKSTSLISYKLLSLPKNWHGQLDAKQGDPAATISSPEFFTISYGIEPPKSSFMRDKFVVIPKSTQTNRSILKNKIPRQVAQSTAGACKWAKLGNEHTEQPALQRSLDFKGRVTRTSVKNFQLVTNPTDSGETGGGEILFQFGKVGKDRFICDFSYPLSPCQAFAVALSKFDI